jgi:hypothetical protein
MDARVKPAHDELTTRYRRTCGKPEMECCGAVDGAPHFASSRKSSLCHRCPAHRLVPSGRPRALGHARVRASPGIRVSLSGLRRAVLDEPKLPATKNPPEQWLGRVRERADCRSCFQAKPLPSTGYASPIGAKPFDSPTLISRSCCIDLLVLFANPILEHSCSRGRGTYAWKCQMSTGKTVMSATAGEMLRPCAHKFVASAFRQAMSAPTRCEHMFPPRPRTRTLLDAVGMSRMGPSVDITLRVRQTGACLNTGVRAQPGMSDCRLAGRRASGGL